jgi:hypothetical protein
MFILKLSKHILKEAEEAVGSYLVPGDKETVPPIEQNQMLSPELCMYNRDIERSIIETAFRNGKAIQSLVNVREIPSQDLWFENVWKEYLEDNLTGS